MKTIYQVKHLLLKKIKPSSEKLKENIILFIWNVYLPGDYWKKVFLCMFLFRLVNILLMQWQFVKFTIIYRKILVINIIEIIRNNNSALVRILTCARIILKFQEICHVLPSWPVGTSPVLVNYFWNVIKWRYSLE